MMSRQDFSESNKSRKLEKLANEKGKPENNFLRKILDSRKKDRESIVEDLNCDFDSLKKEFDGILANPKIVGFGGKDRQTIKESYNEQIRISEANKARALKGIEEDLGYAKWIGYKPFQESLEKLKKLLDDMRTYIGKETIESSITDSAIIPKHLVTQLEKQQESNSDQASTSGTSWEMHYDGFIKILKGDLDDIGEYLNPILPKRVGDLEKEDVCNQQECDMHQAYINRCYTYLRELRFKYEKFKDALLWQSVHSMEKLIQVIEDNSNIKDSDKKVIKEANDIILRIKELDNQYRQRNGEVNEEINHAADLKMAAFLRITQSTIQPQNRSDSDRTSLTSEMREEPLKPPYSINCLPCIKRSVKLEEP